MEFQAVVDRRRMVRRYSPEPVSADSVDRMLRNAVRAPNAGFTQGWSFLVLDLPDDVARFWTATTPPGRERTRWLDGMRGAPVIIVPLSSKSAYVRRYAEPDKGWPADDQPRWAVPYWHVDAGMAALLILQTAVDERLGACFFGLPPDRLDAFRAAFGIPDEYSPVGAVTIGHPEDRAEKAGSPGRRRRKRIEEIVHRGQWRP